MVASLLPGVDWIHSVRRWIHPVDNVSTQKGLYGYTIRCPNVLCKIIRKPPAHTAQLLPTPRPSSVWPSCLPAFHASSQEGLSGQWGHTGYRHGRWVAAEAGVGAGVEARLHGAGMVIGAN